MKSKSTFVMIVVFSAAIMGLVYAEPSNKSDDQQVADLKRTIADLQVRVAKLENRVNDMLTVKPRLIDEHIHQPNQH